MEITKLFTKEASGVSSFKYQRTFFADNMMFSGVSSFYTGNGNKEKTRWYEIELNRFDQLVAVRKEYLDTLPSLGENWISGNSSPPSRAVIEKCKKLLDDFKSYLVRKKQQKTQVEVPKLVMGPIPTGGIGVEFHVNSVNALYVSIFNNDTIEIELKYFDFYSVIEPTDPNRRIIADYEWLVSDNRNSGWGTSLPVLLSAGIS